jgi:protein-S-isoprenylcysteine O-methyltransferase Ste14
MGLDIRWPIGLMFTLIGTLLVIFGAATASNAELYHRSLDRNVNLWWGVVLLIFGGWMLLMAWRGSRNSAGEEKAREQAPSKP